MKTAIVLGASSGVGHRVALALKHGRKVLGFHRGHYPEGAERLWQAGVMTLGADCGTMYSNVVDAVNMAVENLEPGSVDLVVHSLSGASVGTTLGSSPLDVEKTFNRLAHSYLWWVQRLEKTNLLSERCTFLALTNPCPDYYLSNTGVIGAAKAALDAYVTHLGCELAGRGHRAVGLRFSTVVTPALKKVMPEAIPGLVKLHHRLQPQGRMQTADDVADLVLALASPDARWINGTVVNATGGSTAMLMDYAFRSAAAPKS